MVKMMIICVLAFTLCWLPFNLLILLGDLNSEVWNHEYIDLIYFACHWLAMSHASYNPIIYIRMNARFRYGFRFVLNQCLPCLISRQNSTAPAINDHNGHIFNTQATGGARSRSMRTNFKRNSAYDNNFTLTTCQMTTMVYNRSRKNENGDGFDSSPINEFPLTKRDNFLNVCKFKKNGKNNVNNKTNQL